MKLPYTESISKFKIISIYVTTTIIGIMLIFTSVYNASIELEVLHEIDQMNSIFSSRVRNIILTNKDNKTIINEAFLARALDMETYKVYLYPANETYKIGGIDLSSHVLEESQVNQRGGYLKNKNKIYTWTLIPLSGSNKKLLVTHQFQSIDSSNLLLAYKNRLIIPAVFFIWMTVWGALVLSNLVKQILLRKEQAEYLALHDPLTHLANRNLFTENLTELCQYSIRHKKSFCMAVIDLDKFKFVNDTYGHNVGDELLKQAAARFKKMVRNYDLVARLGGDEFIILLPDSDKQQCIDIIERTYRELIKPYTIFSNTLTIGASVGVSIFPEHSQDSLELIRMADDAMYVAKNKGVGIEIYDESVSQSQ